MENHVLGIDIGGSGMKGAIVDLDKGEMITERFRIETPQPATPKKMTKTFKAIVEEFEWTGPIGCGFPSIVKNGYALSAANIDKSWIDVQIEDLFQKASNCDVFVSNDADCAGLAEAHFGAGKGKEGLVILLTIGTGIGSAFVLDGELVPNTELGHIHLKGQDKIAEKYAANSIRKKEDLSWKEWGKRFDKYLEHVNFLFSPDLFILGGGASKHFDNFSKHFSIDTPVVPANLLNKAGIIGAALHAKKKAFDTSRSKTSLIK